MIFPEDKAEEELFGPLAEQLLLFLFEPLTALRRGGYNDPRTVCPGRKQKNKMSKVFVRDREFYKLLLALGLHIVLKNLIVNSVGMADNLMVAALGEAATNGAQMANQLTNFLFTITMNVSAAVTVLGNAILG